MLVNSVAGKVTTIEPAPVDMYCAAGVLNGCQAAITICTTAVNPHYYQRNNTTTTFTNTAILYSGDTKLSSVSASTKPSNVVLAKSCTGYHYGTGTFSWKLAVNDAKVPLSNVSIEETIPYGMNLVEGSLKISTDVIPLYTEGASLPYYKIEAETTGEKKVTIYLPDFANNSTGKTITYATQIDNVYKPIVAPVNPPALLVEKYDASIFPTSVFQFSFS